MANYKHMNLDERMEIQKGLKEGKSFAETGAAIGRDGSTISKEIRSHLIVKETGTRSHPYNPCVHRKHCLHEGDLCGEMCIKSYSWNNDKYCCLCENCFRQCKEFKEETCRLLSKPPYACNSCKEIRSCTLKKQIYDAKEAQKELIVSYFTNSKPIADLHSMSAVLTGGNRFRHFFNMIGQKTHIPNTAATTIRTIGDTSFRRYFFQPNENNHKVHSKTSARASKPTSAFCADKSSIARWIPVAQITPARQGLIPRMASRITL